MKHLLKYVCMVLGISLISFGIVTMRILANTDNFLYHRYIIIWLLTSMLITCGIWILGTVGNIWRNNE